MKYKKLIILTLLLALTSCKYFKGDHCNNTLPVTGVYYNDYDKDAEHFLIIKEDGTFEQLYTNGTIVANMGSGNLIKYRVASSSGFPATIELQFPSIWSQTRIVKFAQ